VCRQSQSLEAGRVISTNQFKVGMTIRYEGETYRIAEYQHVKPGKGGAFVRTKLRNVTTGSLVERTFRPETKFEQLRTESRTMTYLYDEPDQVVFMDQESFEQLVVPKATLAGRFDLMTPNMPVEVVHIDDVPFDVELPTFVDLKIVDTAAGVRGDTVSGGSKTATLETGAVVQVPLFIEPGDVVRIDTRTREYVTRA
jgi:elongation factor P